jgi:hypothetical protein
MVDRIVLRISSREQALSPLALRRPRLVGTANRDQAFAPRPGPLTVPLETSFGRTRWFGGERQAARASLSMLL